MRTCCIVEPDFKYVITGLIASSGLAKSLAKSEDLATKLIEFLNQLPTIVRYKFKIFKIIFNYNLKLKIPNEFVQTSCKNMNLINKIIQMSAMKFIQDKGRQERLMAMMLSFIFAPNFLSEDEKTLFNALLKKIFEFEPNSLMEELLSNIIKEKLSQMNHKVNQSQLDKVKKIKLNFFLILYSNFIFKDD